MDLTGEWRAAPADETLQRTFQLPGFDDDGWERVTVPGHWDATPALAGQTSVLYRRCFEHELPHEEGGRSWLELDGIFSQGDVWLDGEYLGDTEGYFIRHAFDATEPLQARREHELAIEVDCAPRGRLGQRRGLLGIFEGGNDMVPRGNPGGIWAPVRLRHTGRVRIHGLRAICRAANADRAVVAVRAQLISVASRTVRVVSELAGHRHEAEHSIAEGSNEVAWEIEVTEPDLWWPHQLGDQPLYELTVRVETRAGELSDVHGQRIGLRTVTMRRWRAEVNGERLFLKGVNAGPTTPGLADTTQADVDRQLGLVMDAGLALVRPYGHVAHDLFYDRADELGVLVWQDLPLVGAASNSLRGEAVRQARAMVDQLGHHPAIATWNAHVGPAPEWMDAAPPSARRAGAKLAGHQLPTWTKSVLDRSVKRTFEGQDGSRNVSGFTGVLPHMPRLESSPTHLWLGWRRGSERDLPDYAARWPAQVRFVAELGAQSLPDHTPFIDADAWPELDVELLESSYGYEAASFATYVPPNGHEDLDSWRGATQRYQAGLLRRQIEALRRLKYRPTGGFCVHHLVDAMPAVSASLVGSDGTPKLAYEAVQEACRPVIVVADRLPAVVAPGDPVALDVHVVSDRREPLTGAVVDAELTWPGDRHRWRFGGDIGADSVVHVGTLSWMVPTAPGLATLTLRLSGPAEAVNRYDTTIRG